MRPSLGTPYPNLHKLENFFLHLLAGLAQFLHGQREPFSFTAHARMWRGEEEMASADSSVLLYPQSVCTYYLSLARRAVATEGFFLGRRPFPPSFFAWLVLTKREGAFQATFEPTPSHSPFSPSCPISSWLFEEARRRAAPKGLPLPRACEEQKKVEGKREEREGN